MVTGGTRGAAVTPPWVSHRTPRRPGEGLRVATDASVAADTTWHAFLRTSAYAHVDDANATNVLRLHKVLGDDRFVTFS